MQVERADYRETDMKKWLAILALGVATSGCQLIAPETPPGPPDIRELGAPSEPERVERKVAFPAEEYARLDKSGNATIAGRLFITTDSGETIYGAHETVSIAPATTYSAEAAEAALAGNYIEEADPRAQEYSHYAKTDERGYFRATGLPAGVFYVAGRVSEPGPNARRHVIINQVRLGKGQTVEIRLSR